MSHSIIPRISLGFLPTPMVELKRFTQYLGGPRIFMKRDDCTGLAGGGNKTRKLEYLIADALELGCDAVITAGGLQSNHCRQTAAAATANGLKCHLVLVRNVDWNDPDYQTSGNMVLDRLLGAEISIHPKGSNRDQIMTDLAQKLIDDGLKPYVIPVGGSNTIGSVGYVTAYDELRVQCESLGITPSALYHCTSSGGTQAGLIAGSIRAKRPFPIYSVENEDDPASIENIVKALIPATLKQIGSNGKLKQGDINIVTGYGGPAYGLPNSGTIRAIELLARLEGILLDPVYTGKAMAGMMDKVRSRHHNLDDILVFLHTGGAQALGAYPSIFPGK